MKKFTKLMTLLVFSWFLTQFDAAMGEETYWPAWRGPLGTGEAPNATPPSKWDETTNIKWKIPLDGLGYSTPIVWGDRLFLTTAVKTGDAFEPKYSGAPGAHDNLPVTHRHQFQVIAIARKDGKLLWKKTVKEAIPHEGAHYTASLASASPVTDGKYLFAYFGSQGLYCLDFDGKMLWQKDFGKMHSKHGHGEGSSPVLFENTLTINWDHEGESFVVALDKTTGKELWKADREEVTSWSTPIVVTHQKQHQVIVPGTSRVRSYELSSGKILWECGGLSANIVASPVAADGRVFVGSSYEKRALLAIRLEGAKNDITESANVIWSRTRGTPYVPSLLLYDNSLYFLNHYQGILTKVNAKTGEDEPGAIRLDGIRNVYASPVAAANRIYITDRDGATLVLDHTNPKNVLAYNQLNDEINASLAIVGSEIYIRGKRKLYCIAESE